MKQNPPNAHRSQIKMCEKRQTRNVQFRFMQNAFRILKPIQKSSKCVSVFRSTGANAFTKIQMRLAYEDKRELYCITCNYYEISWYVSWNYYEGFYLFSDPNVLYELFEISWNHHEISWNHHEISWFSFWVALMCFRTNLHSTQFLCEE